MVLAIPLFFSSWLWHVSSVGIGLLFGHMPQLCGVTGERSVLVLSVMTSTHIYGIRAVARRPILCKLRRTDEGQKARNSCLRLLSSLSADHVRFGRP